MSAGIFARVIGPQEFSLGLSQLGIDGSNPSPSGGESRANLRRVPSWLGIFAFGSSHGRVEGELSAQGTQFLKPCGGVTHNCGDADHLTEIAG